MLKIILIVIVIIGIRVEILGQSITKYNKTLAYSNDTCCTKKDLRLLSAEATLVIVGEIIEIKPSPNIWSGNVASTQTLIYKVLDILKGQTTEEFLEVRHYLVTNSCTADKAKAQLSPLIFSEGKTFILFLESSGLRNFSSSVNKDRLFDCINEDCGAILASPNNLAQIRKFISKKFH